MVSQTVTLPAPASQSRRSTVRCKRRPEARHAAARPPPAPLVLLAASATVAAFTAWNRSFVLATLRTLGATLHMLCVSLLTLPFGLAASSASGVTVLVDRGQLGMAARMTCWLEAIGLTGKVADSTAVLADRGRADVAAKVSLEAIKQGNPLQQVNITAAMVDRGYLAQAVTCSCAFNIIATQDRQLQLLADLTVVTAQRGYLALLAHTNARMVRMKAADVCARASLALLVNMPQHMNTTRDTTWTMVSEGLSAEAQVIAERVVILGVDANQADAIAQSTCCLVAEPSLVEFVATTNIALVRQGHADKCAAVSRAALAQGEVTAMNTIALKLVSMGHMDVAAQIGLSMLA